jgi:hypothetical protein
MWSQVMICLVASWFPWSNYWSKKECLFEKQIWMNDVLRPIQWLLQIDGHGRRLPKSQTSMWSRNVVMIINVNRIFKLPKNKRSLSANSFNKLSKKIQLLGWKHYYTWCFKWPNSLSNFLELEKGFISKLKKNSRIYIKDWF